MKTRDQLVKAVEETRKAASKADKVSIEAYNRIIIAEKVFKHAGRAWRDKTDSFEKADKVSIEAEKAYEEAMTALEQFDEEHSNED